MNTKKISKPHNLIKVVKKDLLKTTPSHRSGKEGLLIPTLDDMLQIEVTRNNLMRALAFMNDLISLVEEKGYCIKVSNRETLVVLGQEEIRIRFREIQKRVLRSDYEFNSTQAVPSGIVSFKMEKGSGEKEWRDTQEVKIEERLPDIVTAIEVSAKEKKERRLINEANWKAYRLKEEKKKEAKAVKQKEISDFELLINSSGRWHKSQNLRNYLEIFENKARQSNTLSDEKIEWLQWARKKADWYDPFIESDDDVFGDVDRDSF